MSNEHKPGSPVAVDLDELADAACKRALPLSWEAEAEADKRGNGGECIYNAFDVCSSFRDGYKARAAEEESELRTLRARVVELEKCLNGLHLFAGRGDGHETADKVTDCIAGVIIQLRADLEKAEARAESAEARVKELEAWARDLESDARADAEMLHKRDDRITDLESQLESARSSEGMLRALIALLDRDGGQKQAGESLVESCARASHTLVAERHATFIEHEEIAAAREEKARVWEERNRELVRELEETRAFLRRTAMAGGSIVSSASMTPKQIAIARAADRMIVMPDGYGFVYVPCAQSAKDEG